MWLYDLPAARFGDRKEPSSAVTVCIPSPFDHVTLDPAFIVTDFGANLKLLIVTIFPATAPVAALAVECDARPETAMAKPQAKATMLNTIILLISLASP